jgi:hypothetical protein
MNIHIEVISTIAGIFTDETLGIGFVNRSLELNLFVPKLSSYINVSSFSFHGKTNEKCAFNEFVRVVSENFSVFAGAWLRLITVDDEVRRSAVRYLGHE